MRFMKKEIVYNTQCPDCKGEVIAYVEKYGKPENMKCAGCGHEWRFTLCKPVERPETLDIKIRGAGTKSSVGVL